jgi:hypothetical protein
MRLWLNKVIYKTKRFFEAIGRFFKKFDFDDFVSLIALCFIFYGFYIFKPYLAYIVVGCILFIMSTLGAKNRK